mgnify:CR=1 FL=1
MQRLMQVADQVKYPAQRDCAVRRRRCDVCGNAQVFLQRGQQVCACDQCFARRVVACNEKRQVDGVPVAAVVGLERPAAHFVGPLRHFGEQAFTARAGVVHQSIVTEDTHYVYRGLGPLRRANLVREPHPEQRRPCSHEVLYAEIALPRQGESAARVIASWQK